MRGWGMSKSEHVINDDGCEYFIHPNDGLEIVSPSSGGTLAERTFYNLAQVRFVYRKAIDDAFADARQRESGKHWLLTEMLPESSELTPSPFVATELIKLWRVADIEANFERLKDARE